MTTLKRIKDDFGLSYIIQTETMAFGIERVRICSRMSQGKYAIIWAGWFPMLVDRKEAARAIRAARATIKQQKQNDKY
jgi:hypothetical protein